ncbi:hypothetical protein D9M72_571970 [compost metagenome]
MRYSLAMASTGAVVNQPGACACVVWPSMRAIGCRPSCFAVDARIITSAEAPSLIDDDDAAVMVPSLANAGLSDGILSSLMRRGPSSVSITVSPPLPDTVTGTISQRKSPFSVACCARRTLSIANSSCCWRVKPYLATQSSPKVPMARPLSYASSRPSSIMWS